MIFYYKLIDVLAMLNPTFHNKGHNRISAYKQITTQSGKNNVFLLKTVPKKKIP